MSRLTVEIPKELGAIMAKFRDVSWPEVVRSAIVEKARILARMQSLAAGSAMSEHDALRLGREIKRRVLARHR